MRKKKQKGKKIQKNNSIDEIADMLEEEPASISPIYDLIRSHPDWDDERISNELKDLTDRLSGLSIIPS
ncbi:MAG: hypothetical protein HFH91_17550 [Lachnospiraceae bacterium]|nr:hypothetical protein [Lachnospiraceae bacterium]